MALFVLSVVVRLLLNADRYDDDRECSDNCVVLLLLPSTVFFLTVNEGVLALACHCHRILTITITTSSSRTNCIHYASVYVHLKKWHLHK